MKKFCITLATALLVSGCSVNHNNGAKEIWHNYGGSQINTGDLSEEQALAVFYRQGDIIGPAVNVYVNGDYQVSLLENAFSAAVVCADNALYSSSFTTNQKFGNQTQGTRYSLPAQQVSYIKVNIQEGVPSLEQISPEIAEQEIVSLKRSTQTLPRVREGSCDNLMQVKELSASALFPINQSAYHTIPTQGKKEIAEFAEWIKTQPNVSSVEVRGYTDPQGSDAYNQSLSEQRAESVRYVLQQNGITQPIEAVGYGPANLVVNNCASLHTTKKALNECNQPNRRVEIAVYGKNK